MSLPKQAVPRAVAASVVGALIAWAGLVVMIFRLADAQGGIALFISPFVAAPIGLGVGLCWMAYEAPDWSRKASLLLVTLFVIALPIGWLVAELRQMQGY